MKRWTLFLLATLTVLCVTSCKPQTEPPLSGLSIEHIIITDISSSNSGARCEIGPENQTVLDKTAKLMDETTWETEAPMMKRPFFVEIVRADGEVIQLMYGNAGRMTMMAEDGEVYIKNQALEDYFSELYLKYNQIDEVGIEEAPLPPIYAFEAADIKAAEQTIADYYAARVNRDAEALIDLMHPRFGYTMEKYNNGQLMLWESEQLKLLRILPYDGTAQQRFNYHMDKGDGNTLILKVDFEVIFPDGNTNSCYDEGTYTDWAFILVREDAASPWRIYDQGY